LCFGFQSGIKSFLPLSSSLSLRCLASEPLPPPPPIATPFVSMSSSPLQKDSLLTDLPSESTLPTSGRTSPHCSSINASSFGKRPLSNLALDLSLLFRSFPPCTCFRRSNEKPPASSLLSPPFSSLAFHFILKDFAVNPLPPHPSRPVVPALPTNIVTFFGMVIRDFCHLLFLSSSSWPGHTPRGKLLRVILSSRDN